MKFEYLEKADITCDELNQLGDDGWELVSTIIATSDKYLSGVRISSQSIVYYLKRVKR